MKTVADNKLDYLYLSGRVHALSGAVLTRETLERMAEAESPAEALRIMAESGLAIHEGESTAEALEGQKAQLFASLASAGMGKAIVDLFRLPYDSHNAKVLLKEQLAGVSADGLLSRCGSVAPEKVREAVGEQGAAMLPAWLRTGLAQAKQAWTDSRSVQLLDVCMDRACFAGMRQAAKESGSARAEEYVRLCIDGVNLQTVLRMKGANAEAVEEMLLSGGHSSAARILEGRAGGNLSAAFSQPAFHTAAEAGTAQEAERALAAVLADFAARCRQAPYGPETLLGFLLNLELRQAAVRMILVEPGGGDQKAWEVLYG